MYRKEVNERSPMRVFEKSLHGGLGRGNVGVVVARPGVGKTALLVQIALDDLLRDKRVLHISNEHAVERVRAYYDEIFHDLAVSHELAQSQAVRLEVERNRLLFSHLGRKVDRAQDPPSSRGGTTSLSRIEDTIEFATETAGFTPDAVIIEGFDFETAAPDVVASLKTLAKDLDVELWLSAKTQEYAGDGPASAPAPNSTPTPLRRYFKTLDVIVQLRPAGDKVQLELLKDHDNADVSDLQLRLDPTTLRIGDDDLKPMTLRPKNPAHCQLLSGGARGAEAAFGACAERWGVPETHYSFEGHPFLERKQGVVVLPEKELMKGDFSLKYASNRLGRQLTQIPNIKRILQTAWHQISNANEVFVIGALQDNGTVRGGTGWGAELARLWSKPLCVFDQNKNAWYRWDATQWREEQAPRITRRKFAGIGTTSITDGGRKAVEELYARSFGEAKS